MRFRGQSEDQVDVRLGLDELMLLDRALSELCHGMSFSEGDFQAIFGAHRAEVEALLLRVRAVLEHASTA